MPYLNTTNRTTLADRFACAVSHLRLARKQRRVYRSTFNDTQLSSKPRAENDVGMAARKFRGIALETAPHGCLT